MQRFIFGAAFILALSIGAVGIWLSLQTSENGNARIAPSKVVIAGRVVDEQGPVANARVRLRGKRTLTVTDDQGRFSLEVARSMAPPFEAPSITAATPEHLIGACALDAPSRTIRLTSLPTLDNPDYQWVDPTPSETDSHRCGNCHEEIYRQWQGDGHSRAAMGKRFRNLYEGTDWHGRDGRGWSLVDELPEGAGVCAACHAPGVEPTDAAVDDMRLVSGIAALGVHCDFCHKVQSVEIDNLGVSHGRYAMNLLRPSEGQLFFGPLDDVPRDEDVYSPLQGESRFCASCHEGTLFGVHVYSTYSEWLDSPAARRGQSCQSCHNAPNGKMTNIAPGAGGIERDPSTLGSHSFLPGGRKAMLQRCLKVDVAWKSASSQIALHVDITTQNIGHRAPTGFVDRHLILSVQPLDARGNAVDAIEGPRLPDAAGGALAGQPGALFAKRLTDAQGRPAPFWRASADKPEDTRLLPEQTTTKSFLLPASATSARVVLLYRRFWTATAKAKSWPDDTIVVYDHVTHFIDRLAPEL